MPWTFFKIRPPKEADPPPTREGILSVVADLVAYAKYESAEAVVRRGIVYLQFLRAPGVHDLAIQDYVRRDMQYIGRGDWQLTFQAGATQLPAGKIYRFTK